MRSHHIQIQSESEEEARAAYEWAQQLCASPLEERASDWTKAAIKVCKAFKNTVDNNDIASQTDMKLARSALVLARRVYVNPTEGNIAALRTKTLEVSKSKSGILRKFGEALKILVGVAMAALGIGLQILIPSPINHISIGITAVGGALAWPGISFFRKRDGQLAKSLVCLGNAAERRLNQ